MRHHHFMTDEMERFIAEHPEFSGIYERTKAMMKTREDLLNETAHMMYTEDIVASLNRTYATRNKKLVKKVEEQAKTISMVQQESLQKDEKIAQQANRIAELEEKLRNVH